LDEEYLACLIECTVCGSTKPEHLHRDKIRRAMARKPYLVARLEQSRRLGAGSANVFIPEHDRVQNVALKLARGHALFELNEPRRESPYTVSIRPLVTMVPEERNLFESVPCDEIAVWTEVGSRALVRIVEGKISPCGWIEVQHGRYRYLAAASDAVIIRFVISEYIAAEFIWR
jgi:hypothetical protein